MLITEIISLLQLIHTTSSRVPRPDFFEVKKKIEKFPNVEMHMGAYCTSQEVFINQSCVLFLWQN